MRWYRDLKLHLLLSGVLLFCASRSSGAIEFPVALSPEEVECDRQQLEHLALRMVVSEVEPGAEALNPSLFLWRQASGGASYSGLAVTDSVREDSLGKIRDERQLSIEMVFGEKGDRLDPRRPLLPHVTIARRSQDSNLVVATSEPWMTITMEVAAIVEDPYVPKIPLAVNSLKTNSGRRQSLPAADALGRGLLLADGLPRGCHAKLTAFDERIFRILSRALRLTKWFTLLGASPNDPTTWNIALFRGEDPHLYRGTILGYQRVRNNDGTTTFFRFDPTALEFEIQWDAQGRLTDGEIRLFPQPHTGRLSIFLLPPMFPGRDQQREDTFAGKPFLRFDYTDAQSNIFTAPVNWRDLLADSSWNQ